MSSNVPAVYEVASPLWSNA